MARSFSAIFKLGNIVQQLTQEVWQNNEHLLHLSSLCYQTLLSHAELMGSGEIEVDVDNNNDKGDIDNNSTSSTSTGSSKVNATTTPKQSGGNNANKKNNNSNNNIRKSGPST